MKKLIAISVIFALVAGAAFAQDAALSFTVFGNVIVADGANDDQYNDANGDNQIKTSSGHPRVRFEASAQNDAGTFGGWMRDIGAAKVWWKPIDMLTFQIGYNPDGEFGKEGVTGWGMYQIPSDMNVILSDNFHGWGYQYQNSPNGQEDAPFLAFSNRQAFYGGYGDNSSAGIVLSPMDALNIYVAIPWNKGEIQDTLLSSVVQAEFNAEGIGTFALTFEGGGKKTKKQAAVAPVPGTAVTDWTSGSDLYYDGSDWVKGYKPGKDAVAAQDPNHKIYLYAGLSLIENLGLDIGFAYNTLGGDIGIGLGANFDNGGAFGVKGRLTSVIGGGDEDESEFYESIAFVFDVNPWYKVSDNIQVFFGGGITYLMFSGDTSDYLDNQMAWHLSPYVLVTDNFWGYGFFAGIHLSQSFKLAGADYDTAVMRWAIPIGLWFNF